MNEQCGIYRVIDILNMYNIQGDTKEKKKEVKFNCVGFRKVNNFKVLNILNSSTI